MEASAPRGATLSVYDVGYAQVAELRTVNLTRGPNEVVVRSLPARLDPGSVTFAPATGRESIQVLQQRFLYDLEDPARMLRRYLGLPVEIATTSGRIDGVLAGLPVVDASGALLSPLALRRADGAAVLFLNPSDLSHVTFPGAAAQAYLEPTLVWQTEAESDVSHQLRLSYLLEGIRWEAAYELMLAPGMREGSVSVRLGIENRSGGAFERARLRLIATPRGMAPSILPDRDRLERPLAASDPALRSGGPLRFRYGGREPQFERMAAGVTPVQVYELPHQVDLRQEETLYVHYASVANLPVKTFHVYDGVMFDRFRTPRRNDWNYGTESHHHVETHVEFENASKFGLGMALPPGRFRVYQRQADESLDLVGEDHVTALEAGAMGHVVLGPSRGLHGERERLSYTEVRPLEVYDESFVIRLRNETPDEVEIRVVEHLYRWPTYEILKADTEYVVTAPQVIEFRATLPPGGTRQISYTVRYRW